MGQSPRTNWEATLKSFAFFAAAACAAVLAADARAAQPPPPPADYGTIACVTFGFNVPGCPGYPVNRGFDSSVQTPDGYGPVYAAASAQPGAVFVAANVATGAAQPEANAGATLGDFLYLDDPQAADGAWLPVQMTLQLGGTALYSAAPADLDRIPFAGAFLAVDNFGNTPRAGVGTGRYEDVYVPSVSFEVGLYNRTWMPLTLYMGAYAGIDRFSALSTVSVVAHGSIVIRPGAGSAGGRLAGFDAAAAEPVRLYSASGFDYTTAVPQPPAAALALSGAALLSLRFFRPVRRRRTA
jgi:hypothetical protein